MTDNFVIQINKLLRHLLTLPGHTALLDVNLPNRPGMVISKKLSPGCLVDIRKKIARIEVINNTFFLEYYPGVEKVEREPLEVHLTRFDPDNMS